MIIYSKAGVGILVVHSLWRSQPRNQACKTHECKAPNREHRSIWQTQSLLELANVLFLTFQNKRAHPLQAPVDVSIMALEVSTLPNLAA